MITGGHPRYGLSAPGSPWVQELDGPLEIKALFLPDPYTANPMTPRGQSRGRISLPAIAAAVALLVSVGATACGSGDGGGNPDSRLTPEQAEEPLADSPPQLAAIRAQANQLLDGGAQAFDQRLEELRGFPVVVNKWASWCGPCRFEFPWFQALAEKRGGEIAFLGDAGDDSEDALSTFLDDIPSGGVTTGNGWVNAAASPGTSLAGTARSSIA